LRKLIAQAYRVKDFQLSGPDWLNSEIYDIVATMPPTTSTDQVLSMMQNLLADRFQLALHRETREVPMYALAVGKGGLKIKGGEFGHSSTSGSPGHLTAQKKHMAKLADSLASQLGSPVTDMTGMKGFFDFTLEWTPDARPAEAGVTSEVLCLCRSRRVPAHARSALPLQIRRSRPDVTILENVRNQSYLSSQWPHPYRGRIRNLRSHRRYLRPCRPDSDLAVPLWALGEQAVLRRQSWPHGFHR
jgi:uncharacterized protein (TIGR03435 family)